MELYNKICEAVSLLGDLMDIERLTDTIVLQVIYSIVFIPFAKIFSVINNGSLDTGGTTSLACLHFK